MPKVDIPPIGEAQCLKYRAGKMIKLFHNSSLAGSLISFQLTPSHIRGISLHFLTLSYGGGCLLGAFIIQLAYFLSGGKVISNTVLHFFLQTSQTLITSQQHLISYGLIMAKRIILKNWKKTEALPPWSYDHRINCHPPSGENYVYLKWQTEVISKGFVNFYFLSRSTD